MARPRLLRPRSGFVAFAARDPFVCSALGALPSGVTRIGVANPLSPFWGADSGCPRSSKGQDVRPAHLAFPWDRRRASLAPFFN